jgi:NAD(P)H-dependent FMN reductase
MHYVLVVGSHRTPSQSRKVANYIEKRLKKDNAKNTVDIFDLGEIDLPFWNMPMWQKDSDMRKAWAPYAKRLAKADAFVMIAPEWGGMVPAELKNLFLLADRYELAHKPALIVSVSSGRSGGYPVSELRMSSYKNTYICYLPSHVIVRKVEDVLNNQKMVKKDKGDYYIKNRMNYELQCLAEYGKALKNVRKSGVFDYKQFPFGM